MEYKTTVGLEIHVELKTLSGMFCSCPNDPDCPEPNRNVCPVCLGLPGALPTINKQAVEAVIKVGLALGGTIAKTSKFDRKNYFYPDLPKGYQISQYDQPLVSGGKLLGVRLKRIHLEEDTASLSHAESSVEGTSLVNFNRSGVPLMELVTEPDLHSGNEVANFARELQLILRYLKVSDADMEKGQLRIEPNISVASFGSSELGTKVEVKNINSFRAAMGAVEYEAKRQADVLEKGEKVIQENRGWSEGKQATVSQRSKENAQDYRYFPEPDLPPFCPGEVFDLEVMKASLPELPDVKRERFVRQFSLTAAQADALVATPQVAEFYENAESELSLRDKNEVNVQNKAQAQALLFNYLTSDLKGLLNETGVDWGECKVNPEELAHLVDLIADGKIASRQAKDILRAMVETGEDPEDLLGSLGLQTISDAGELQRIVAEVIAQNEKSVADFKAGREASLQFLIGQAMGRLKGKANPTQLGDLLEPL